MNLNDFSQENSSVTIKPLIVKTKCYVVMYETDSLGVIAVFFDKISADEHAEYLEKLTGNFHCVVEAPLV